MSLKCLDNLTINYGQTYNSTISVLDVSYVTIITPLTRFSAYQIQVPQNEQVTVTITYPPGEMNILRIAFDTFCSFDIYPTINSQVSTTVSFPAFFSIFF